MKIVMRDDDFCLSLSRRLDNRMKGTHRSKLEIDEFCVRQKAHEEIVPCAGRQRGGTSFVVGADRDDQRNGGVPRELEKPLRLAGKMIDAQFEQIDGP